MVLRRSKNRFESPMDRYTSLVPGDDFADLEQKQTEAQHPRNPALGAAFGALVLAVIDGPDAGRSLAIDENQPAPALIGRSPACSLRLT
jgi:hypothetical protein